MKHILLGTGMLALAASTGLADPVPTQTPAQIEASGGVAASEQMQSPVEKAAAAQAGKAKVVADADKPKVVDTGNNDGGAMIPGTHVQGKATIDNGHNDGGAAIPEATP